MPTPAAAHQSGSLGVNHVDGSASILVVVSTIEASAQWNRAVVGQLFTEDFDRGIVQICVCVAGSQAALSAPLCGLPCSASSTVLVTSYIHR